VSVLGVEADDETRILHFKVPRHYCEVDLAEFAIRVNYKNAKSEGDMYIVTDAVVEDDWITFDWVVGRHAFTKKGNVVFNVCLKDVFEGIVRREFNTTVAILPVLEGLETGEEIAEEHLDIFEQLREELASGAYEIAGEAVGSYINEHIDEIKGPKGDAFKYEDFTPEQLESLRGSKGEAFKYEDFTPEQLESLKGSKGDSFEYEDFTEEQLAKLVGPSGSSIKSIIRTSGTGAPGTTDTYTVTLTDGSTTTFQVYNGKDGPAGSGAGDMLASMYDPQGKKQDIFQYVDDAVANIDIPDIELPDDIGDMQMSVYDPQDKKQDIFKYVDDAVGNIDIPDASGIPDLGENITEGYANDTVAFWATKGSGQAWFSSKGMLVNQPSQYGFVISYTNGADAFQMFSDQTNGVTYFRYGDNINNWFKHWTALELPGMATTTELGLVMVNGNNGIGVNTENGNLFIKQASNSEIDGKEHSYKPITPENLDYAVKSALTNNANDLSDSERTSALGWLGAASSSHEHDHMAVFPQGGHNADTCYDAGLYMMKEGAGVPTGSQYGSLLTLPYRGVRGNNIPDFGVQIFIPNGDDATHPDSMFFRTSESGAWHPWNEVSKVGHSHSNYVPTARTVNGKALSSNITLSASDVGAAASDHTHDNLGGSTFYEATIGTNWTENEDTGVKSQTIQITGVTASKNAHVEPRYTGDGTSDGYATFVEQKNQFFTCITNGYAETIDGGIAFHIFGDVNTMSIPVLVEVK